MLGATRNKDTSPRTAVDFDDASHLPSNFGVVVGQIMDPVVLAVVWIACVADDAGIQCFMRDLVDDKAVAGDSGVPSKVETARRILVENPSPARLGATYKAVTAMIKDAVRAWHGHPSSGDLEAAIKIDEAIIRAHERTVAAGHAVNPVACGRLTQTERPPRLRPFQETAIRFRLSQRILAKKLIEQYQRFGENCDKHDV